jgi:hypothetical protein
MQHVLSFQDDFWMERPLIQSLIEDSGHICLFLPKFHCELNPIEILWGYGKYHMCIIISRALRPRCHPIQCLYRLSGYHNLSDGKFATAKALVPECLDSCGLITIRRFFQKSWRYLDTYEKGLDMKQATYANKKYKSYHKVGLPRDIIDSMGESNIWNRFYILYIWVSTEIDQTSSIMHITRIYVCDHR